MAGWVRMFTSQLKEVTHAQSLQVEMEDDGMGGSSSDNPEWINVLNEVTQTQSLQAYRIVKFWVRIRIQGKGMEDSVVDEGSQ